MKIYENDEIYVRPFRQSDAFNDCRLDWFFDQEVCKYTSHGKLSHPNIDYTEFEEVNENVIKWTVIVKKKLVTWGTIETYIGNVQLNIDWINRKGEFTCIFGGKEYWGKGYCTQVLKWMIEHGLKKLNLNKIWLGTAEKNHGMNQAAQKAGMEIECKIENELFIDGEYQSINRWCIYQR